MSQFTTDYVGLDVHKESVDISVATGGGGEGWPDPRAARPDGGHMWGWRPPAVIVQSVS